MDAYVKYIAIRWLHKQACRILKIEPDSYVANRRLERLYTEFGIGVEERELLDKRLDEDIDILQLISEVVVDVHGRGVRSNYKLPSHRIEEEVKA